MQALDYEHYAYLAITLSSSTVDASTLHPSARYMHSVGQLSDTHLYRVPKGMEDDVLESLKEREGVSHVEIVKPKMRVKRGGDEL